VIRYPLVISVPDAGRQGLWSKIAGLGAPRWRTGPSWTLLRRRSATIVSAFSATGTAFSRSSLRRGSVA
jgi:hypothetical protein